MVKISRNMIDVAIVSYLQVIQVRDLYKARKYLEFYTEFLCNSITEG